MCPVRAQKPELVWMKLLGDRIEFSICHSGSIFVLLVQKCFQRHQRATVTTQASAPIMVVAKELLYLALHLVENHIQSFSL